MDYPDAIMMVADNSPRRAGELLRFAATLGHLERGQLQVVDTIRMAKLANRRLDLGWSRRRWRDEHDALTRQLTAKKRREQEGLPFDTGWLEEVLGAAPGFANIAIFASSMDLVREGEVQGHCISTYVDQFRRDSLGGLSLGLDAERWTVTLKPPPAGGRKATVYKIHGRRNRLPSASTRRRIVQALGPRIADTRQVSPVTRHPSRTEASVWQFPWHPRRLL